MADPTHVDACVADEDHEADYETGGGEEGAEEYDEAVERPPDPLAHEEGEHRTDEADDREECETAHGACLAAVQGQ